MRKILCAVDFSGINQKIINYVINLAKNNGSKIYLLHVSEPPSAFLGDDFGPQIARDLKAETIKKERQKLDEITANIKVVDVEVSIIHQQGSTVETILEVAKEREVDIIVLGSHGRGVIANAIMGSTSEGVVNKSRCPVLIIPHSME